MNQIEMELEEVTVKHRGQSLKHRLNLKVAWMRAHGLCPPMWLVLVVVCVIIVL